MLMLLLFAASFTLGWAVGSGNAKAIWAWLTASVAAVLTFLEPIIETVKGLF